MKAFFLSLAAGAAIVYVTGCQPSGSSNEQTADTVSTTDTVPVAATLPAGPQCFTQVVGKDTARLQFTVTGDSVTGKLTYKRYEKDSNKGDIKGTVHGNIIDVQYSFMSEGVMSTNQAVFKVEGDKVYEGRAGEFDKEGRPVFGKDLGRVRFDSVGFVKGECW
ncbi:MAG TPA: hypothetical protein VGD35_10860 [Chitinophaga sp.]